MPRQKKYDNQTEYKNQFIAANYDRINLTLPKGRKKEIQDYLRPFSPRISVNEYINKLIEFDLIAKDEAEE